MSNQFVAFLAPQGDSLANYDRHKLSSAQPAEIPKIFKDCMQVREEVFVDEQEVPLENEFDNDDPRSYHWVVYASVPTVAFDDHGRKHSEGGQVPVGTLRLVPPPHPPLSEPGSHHKTDNAETKESAYKGDNEQASFDYGHEPYIKFGRLAILKPYRGLGLSSLLVQQAEDWARKHAEEVSPEQKAVEREIATVGGEEVKSQRWEGLVFVHAQAYLERMWSKFGFKKDVSMGVWDEERIKHIGMWKRVPVTSD